MKKILGLDLGTNSVGWALVTLDERGNKVGDIKLGSRIIPMSQDILGTFESGGELQSQTALRTSYRSVRRLHERQLLRREQLFRVLHILNFLPAHFESQIGWDKTDNKTYGKFKDEAEPKIAWDGKTFLFQSSFNEMLAEFAKVHPDLVADGHKIPYDWTLYYLRKKALTRPVTREELAWIILNFNQKRGYYQLRGEEEEKDENKNRNVEYCAHKVVDVTIDPEENKKGNTWYNVILDNGWIYRRSSKTPLDNWIGLTKEFIVTTDYEPDGVTVKKRSFRAPQPDDWGLQKIRTENDLHASGKTVGAFIYDSILANPSIKIIGKLVRTIERKYYREELKLILEKQKSFIPELTQVNLYQKCLDELFGKNQNLRAHLAESNICEVLQNQIIFYQRPLKSKKSLIDNCPYESYQYVDHSTGEVKTQHIKCAAKSNPYFQEFRVWQFLQNLRIFERERIVNGKYVIDYDCTQEFIPDADTYEALFHYLNNRKEIAQDTLLKEFFKIKKPKGKDSVMPYRWNYVEEEGKKYPCNETRAQLIALLEKCGAPVSFLSDAAHEYELWHLLYSVEDKIELEKALQSFANKYPELGDKFVGIAKKQRPFDKDYASYSEKAIKKLLAVMRTGSLWSVQNIDNNTQNRIQKLIDGEVDPAINDKLREHLAHRTAIESFKFLPVWEACYVVYGRHSEAKEAQQWKSPQDLDNYITCFRQYSLRNPIVEQIIMETLRTVRDIWREQGSIDEIHLELGRDMKNPKKDREKMSSINLQNESTNLRIKTLLMELKADSSIANVRPYSPMHQDKLRLYEEGALLGETDIPADILKISTQPQPSHADLVRYKLWLEQRYVSPYTGKAISLARLFTSAYEIEHVIPQSRYFDDSFSNKVICESEVNKLKDNMLGYEFIKNYGGAIVPLSGGDTVKIFSTGDYEQFVKSHYKANKKKLEKLLMEEIPASFNERQMNDSRYISKFIKGVLSNIVRVEGEEEAISKNLIVCTGSVTDRLKKDWGLNDVWNQLVYPRYERMNALTGTSDFGYWDNKKGKRVFQTQVPLELQRGYSKKRIDHRHHAMDALAIACASRSIVNYLSNQNAESKDRCDLRALLVKDKLIIKPWEQFTQDALQALAGLVVSFKQMQRIINRTTNITTQYNAEGEKVRVHQTQGDSWAIRKPLHQESYFGHVNLRKIKEVSLSVALKNWRMLVDKELKTYIAEQVAQGVSESKLPTIFKENDNQWNGRDVSRLQVYYFTDEEDPMVAIRKPLDTKFTVKDIESITDTGIQKILLNFLETKGGDPTIAFTPEGIDEMNKNIALYNRGIPHQPIYRVRLSRSLGEKFIVGQKGNKKTKYVIAAAGTNLFYAIYVNEQGVRSFETIPLNVVAERLKQGDSPVPQRNLQGLQLLFSLSPNDLVYVPDADENPDILHLDVNRIYKMVSCTGGRSHYIGYSIATSIQDKVEFTQQNKMERSLDGKMIKEVCMKLEVDRLGNILRIIK